MAERNYVGKGKHVGKFGNIKIGLKLEQLQRFVNSAGYVNIIVQAMREEDKYGNGFTVYIDDFVPQQREGSQQQTPSCSGAAEDDTLPF